MRNGNDKTPSAEATSSYVLTVPMRNGNAVCVPLLPRPCKVLTVPMRNGNVKMAFSIWVILMVLTVPMRNGNSSVEQNTLQGMREFLPYLWGMETTPFHRKSQYLFSSYRTYEEWKPVFCAFVLTCWKPEFLPYLWGMETPLPYNYLPLGCVLTVPMRNGNMSNNLPTKKISNVLTVPMRNGNNASSSKSFNDSYQFLPYLWGMETVFLLPKACWFVRSYRTYEEWKLAFMLIPPLSFWVLTVPMRNGNSSMPRISIATL